MPAQKFFDDGLVDMGSGDTIFTQAFRMYKSFPAKDGYEAFWKSTINSRCLKAKF